MSFSEKRAIIRNTENEDKNIHNESEEHKENISQKKLVDEKWRVKLMS